MAPDAGPGQAGSSTELADLARTLRETEARILAVAAGEVDAVLDDTGEPHLLPAARASLIATAATGRVVSDILDALPVNIAMLDTDGRIVAVNAGWRRFATDGGPGIEVPIAGVNDLDISLAAIGADEESGRRAALGIRAVLDGSLPRFELEYPLHSPTRERWFRLVATPVITHAGTGAAVMHLDITEEVLAERARAESAAMYRALFEDNPQPTWVHDPASLRFLAVNDAAVRAYGYSVDEFLAMSIADISPAEEVPRLLESIAADPDGLEAAGVWRHRRRTGEVFEVEIFAASMTFAGHRARIVLAMDVSHQVAAATAMQEKTQALEAAVADLAASEQRYQALVERAGDAVLVADGTGRYLEANPAAGELLGVPVDAILGRSLADFVERVDEVGDGSAAWQAFLAAGEMRGTVRLRRPGGAVRVAEFRATAHILPGRHLSILRDVTEQRALEEQLRQAQRLESVGQLTGGVAHDFNNLLTVIMGNAELLVDTLGDRPDARDLARMTLGAAERGAELTKALLAFSRRQALEPRPVEVNRLIAGMDGLLRRSIGEHVEVEFIRAAGLWPALVDPAQLEGAILNLALNARDAMPDGGRLTIETANASLDSDYAEHEVDLVPGQYVLVAVSDTGTGIAPEHLTRVFDPFFTTKPRGRGTGLGLSMVYGFAKQSGGHVKIYSELGSGTTVRMYLPRAATVHEEAPAPVPHPVAGGGETVLLVEDDALVRRFAEETLTSLGYRVIGASNGPAALSVLANRPDIDLLFTDVVMPGGMSGRQLAEAALELRPGLRVLYTSGYTENAIIHHGRLDPGLRLLSKPYKRADLARALRDVLGSG